MKKVVKFGGSSLADPDHFRKAAEIICADPDRRYVVPSAPGRRFPGDEKVTDMLYQAYEKLEAGEDPGPELEKIKKRYEDIASGLGLDLGLDDEFVLIRRKMEQGAGRDYTASRGEYLNGKVLAAFLGFEFVDAAEVIRFDDDGSFNQEKTNTILSARVEGLDHVVIPGFYGLRDDGMVQTFTRGGSDITGSVVAAAVHADLYENWTDVSGFLVADPGVIDGPEVIDTITYKELRELSYMGASVLHEDAIFPVRREGIPINIRNTNKPEDRGTYIVETTSRRPKYVITGIAGKKGFVSITIEKDMMNSEIGFCRKVLQVFEDNGLSIEHMPSGIDTMTIFVHQTEFVEREQQVISGIHRAVQPDILEIESGLALIAVVGRGMRDTRGIAGSVFSALASRNINIKMIDQGSSELNIIIGVKEKYFEDAITVLYDTFIPDESDGE
ncbi:MAG: aspartate kinase [Lachnospiraceae bacterium]|nr:aspartate kinase [Lachnospiraceae bacterium]